MATVYSRALAAFRFQYDESNEYAYGYFFPSSSGSPTGACAINVHGGGFSPLDYDLDSDYNPARAMVAGNVLNDLEDAGAHIIVLEYPLGSDVSGWRVRNSNETRYPETWQSLARAVQFIKDNCATGGLFAPYGMDADELIAVCNSAGSMTMMMVQWMPDSWGMFPRSPGPAAALGWSNFKSDHRVKALVMTGPPSCTIQDDPGRLVFGAPGPLPVILEHPHRCRPRVAISGTVSGTLAAGDRLQLSTDTTINGTLKSYTAGSPATAQLWIEGGTAESPVNGGVWQKVGATSNTFTISSVPVIEDYWGWFELPDAWKEAMSPLCLFDYMTEADLDAARTVPVFAHAVNNPSVQFRPLEHDNSAAQRRAFIAGKHGVDDAFDIPHIEHRLAALGGFTFEGYWGDDADTLTNPREEQVITGATNASPIVITVQNSATAPYHGIRTGDTIKVGQCAGNTAANGVWTVTRISDTQFSLDGSTGNGTYTSGGVWCFHNAAGSYSGNLGSRVLTFCRDVAGVDLN